MRFRLALAMSRHAGKPLTQELASQILDDVCSLVGRPIRLGQFEQRAWRGYTLQAERIAGQESALIDVERAYRTEVGAPGEWHAAAEMRRLRDDESAGVLLMLTARTAAGNLAGVMRVRVSFDVSEHQVKARDEMLYVVPEHRGWLGYELPRYAEACAFAMGARDFTLYCLESTDSARLARFAGYRKVATVFQKVAQDACDPSQMPTRHREGVANEPLASH